MSIQAILFDLDDTLLWDERSVAEAFAVTCHYAQLEVGVVAEQLEAEVQRIACKLYTAHETYSFTQKIGINPFEALWGHFTAGKHPEFRQLQQWVPQYRLLAWTQGLQAVGVDHATLGAELAQKFMEARRSRCYVYEETYEVLTKLQIHYPLLLLTNGSPDLQQEKLNGVPKLLSYFDHVVISGNYAEGKPAISLFQQALLLLRIGPRAGLMVGDKLTTDIQGARNVGMHHAWLNRARLQHTGAVQPEYEISQLSQLFVVIDQINANQR